MNNRLLTINDRANVSLVGFYGQKPLELILLLERLQAYLANNATIQDHFIAYSLEQVHGTIIGCEGLKSSAGIMNQWIYEIKTEVKYIDYAGWLEYLKNSSFLPWQLRFGGYQLDRDYGFLSRGLHPGIRSFQLQVSEKEIIPVLIGWSWKNNLISEQIDCLRRAGQNFNLLHKYHRDLESIDNDFYLRLGTIEGKLSNEEILRIESEVRKILSDSSPLNIILDRKDISFARYQDLVLTPKTTITIPLLDATPSQIELLYQ
jgi:hypothetical protein